MREFFKDLGEKPFRADQVMKWMYHYCCDNFDEMTDINKVLRGKLKEVAEIRAPEVVEEQRSSDGTIKWAIAVGDQRVETVYIPEEYYILNFFVFFLFMLCIWQNFKAFCVRCKIFNISPVAIYR